MNEKETAYHWLAKLIALPLPDRIYINIEDTRHHNGQELLANFDTLVDSKSGVINITVKVHSDDNEVFVYFLNGAEFVWDINQLEYYQDIFTLQAKLYYELVEKLIEQHQIL